MDEVMRALLRTTAANPDTPYRMGQDAALRGEDRNPPDEMEGEAAASFREDS